MSRDTVVEPQPDVIRIQEQLLEMLRTAGKEVPPPRREAVPVKGETPAVTAPSTTPTKPAATQELTGPPPAGTECPKCFSDTPWGKSSWCPDCGYYPKAGFGGTGIAIEEDEIAPQLIDIIPEWVLPTVLGAVGLFVSSIVTRFVFHDPLQRSFVAISQLLTFTSILLAVHARASYIAINSGRSLMAIVNPGETWTLILSRMPKTKLLVLLLGWSLAGIACSFIVSTEVDLVAEHIAQEVKDNPKITFKDIMEAMGKVTKKAFGKKFEDKNIALTTIGQLVQATGQIGGAGASGGDELEGAIGSLAETSKMLTDESAQKAITGAAAGQISASNGQSGSTASNAAADSAGTSNSKDKKTADEGDDKSVEQPATVGTADAPSPEKTMDLIVFGYTTNPEGELRSLLLATTGRNGKIRYSQKLGVDDLTKEELSKMTEQLKPYRTREPAVTCPYGGKWVKPVVKCTVGHEGLSDGGRPIDPKFHKLILP